MQLRAKETDRGRDGHRERTETRWEETCPEGILQWRAKKLQTKHLKIDMVNPQKVTPGQKKVKLNKTFNQTPFPLPAALKPKATDPGDEFEINGDTPEGQGGEDRKGGGKQGWLCFVKRCVSLFDV
eukprot:1393310-Amorphochlora_amoeboformis.AAC.1